MNGECSNKPPKFDQEAALKKLQDWWDRNAQRRSGERDA